MTRFLALVIFTGLVFLSSANMDVHAQTGSNSSLEDAEVKKVVSAGGSITEIIYSLNAQDRLVGVDSSSMFPAQARSLPIVGYYRQLSPEGVLSTGAEQLIAISGVGNENTLEQLITAGVDVHILPNPKSFKGLSSLITEVGKLVDRKDSASKLNQSLSQQISEMSGAMSSESPDVAFFMSINEQGLMAAGQDTVPNLIFEHIGANNVFADVKRYSPVSIEALVSQPPELLLLPAHQAGGQSAQQICDSSTLRVFTKLYGCRVQIVDSLSFLGLTPRLPEAMAKTKDLLNEQKS